MGNAANALESIDIIPSVTTCDELVIASVSNWGVYGVIAVLSSLTGENLFGYVEPESTVNFLIANGCVDGVTKRNEASEDGFPIEVSKGILKQLHSLIYE
jgi:hypothetical protein